MSRTQQLISLLFCAGLASGAGGGSVVHAGTNTIGLVVVSLRTAVHETPFMDECPEGVAIGNDEIWWKNLSPRDRDRLTEGGKKEAASRRSIAAFRGPGGEDVCWSPTVVTDPPMRTIKGKLAYGLNLDGTSDGAATARTCTHQKFASPDGSTAVDNQMYRLVGCIHGWRSKGYIELVSDSERRDSSQGVTLIEISGVDDVRNSPDVTVKFYRAADVMPKDAKGAILPFASYRPDGNPRYDAVARGRIVNGVLITEPIDVRLPFYGNRVETEFSIRDLRLQIDLDDTGASGLMAGYHDLANWWDYVRKMGYLVETAQFSCPALYKAAVELADGYPDPATGACSAISVAYNVTALRAFIIHAPKPPSVGAPAQLRSVAGLPPGIMVNATPRGQVLGTREGQTLYTNVAGSACAEDCANRFAPLPAALVTGANEPWSVAHGADGLPQWAYKGQPVFTCIDEKANAQGCDAKSRTPIIIEPAAARPAWVTTQPSEYGRIVADATGRTLYRLIGKLDGFKKEICNEACFNALWHVVPAEAGAQAVANWSPITLGTQQVWALNGSPLYTFANDTGPSHIAGHRFGGASVSAANWFSAIRLDDLEQSSAPLSPEKELP